MRKAWIVLGFLLVGANESLSPVSGAIIPPGGYRGALPVRAGAVLKLDRAKSLVLVGTVTKIYPVAGRLKRWAVVVHVDRVVSGEFSDTTFTFAVHSPSRAGLSVGRAYLINAAWDGGGYVVDELRLKEIGARAKPAKKY